MKIITKREDFSLARIRKNLTKKELAKLVKVSPEALGQIERGILNAGVKTANKICKVLDSEFEEIFELRR